MPASRVSVSSDRQLVIGLNWLGDAVMSIPAVLALRRRQPQARITVLVRPQLRALWEMVPGLEAVAVQAEGLWGVPRTAAAIRRGGYATAWVMPKSFRAALLARLGGVPERIGLAGHSRDALLTRVVALPAGDARHQCHEYLDLVGAPAGVPDAPPFVTAPPSAVARVQSRLAAAGGEGAAWVGMFPGAARGPSKRWPAERFGEVARRLAGEMSCRLAILGSAADRDVCAEVAAAAGERALNLAGATPLDELAAWLGACRLAIGNDSGGLHLAAAVGCPVVAIFGLTDPRRTAPLGRAHRWVVAEGVAHSRDIGRKSEDARRALLSIPVSRVYDAAAELLGGDGIRRP